MTSPISDTGPAGRLGLGARRAAVARGDSCLEVALAEALGSGAGVTERLGAVLSVLERQVGVERSVVYAADGQARRLDAASCHGVEAFHFRPRYGVGVAGRAAQSRQGIVVPEVRLDPMALSELTRADHWLHASWSLFALPLLAGEELVGVLCCYGLGGEVPERLSASALLIAPLLASALLQARVDEGEDDAGVAAPKSRRTDGVFEYANMVGSSPFMRQVYEEVAQVARTNATTLIRGESGTGKELVASAIHANSERALQPLIKVNCAALPEPLFESELFGHERGAYTGAHARRRGRFELAQGGTLFLDEIGELTLPMQAKLLRVLQAREFERVGGTETLRTDVRVLAATNRNLEERVESGAFRQDLYYRLNVFSITVPPLRGRRADIWALSEYFVNKCALAHRRNVTGLSTSALDLLGEYAWPGNVRELENAIERAVVVCDGVVIQERHLPAALRSHERREPAEKRTLREAVAELEKQMLSEALVSARGNCAQAARALGVTERVVRYKTSLYGIDVQRLR